MITSAEATIEAAGPQAAPEAATLPLYPDGVPPIGLSAVEKAVWIPTNPGKPDKQDKDDDNEGEEDD